MRAEASNVGLKEFIRRSLDGPVMRELDFDLKLSRQLRRLTSEYSIHFNPQEIICDDATADAIWQAALQLLERVGIYNVDTNRVVSLPSKEVEAAAAGAPKEFTVGEGKDAVTIKAFDHGVKVPPVILAQPAKSFHIKGSVQAFVAKLMEAYVSDAGPLGDLARQLENELDGIPYMAETPGEMIWARAVVRWKRAVADLLGKPGLHLGSAEVTSLPAILALYTEKGLLHRFNSQISVSLIPNLKLNWDRLRLAYAARSLGVYRSCSADPVVGAYCRNSEEAAVVALASVLGSMMYAGDEKTVQLSTVDREGNRTAKAPLQASSAARRSIERNLGIPMDGIQNIIKNGLGTSLSLYELAALTLAQSASGWAWSWRYPCAPGPKGEYTVDLDYKFVTKISRGATGLSREKTNELVAKLLQLYENRDADGGKPFAYYYDIKTLTPSMELVALFDRVEEQLQRLGVPMG
ncbi:MAG: monomethylamine:corrinoid methyltransferase [Chloroflexi bacterium]|nr:monomethylamine:corrinoid methyltransferase [Chloroflexota bacterium]